MGHRVGPDPDDGVLAEATTDFACVRAVEVEDEDAAFRRPIAGLRDSAAFDKAKSPSSEEIEKLPMCGVVGFVRLPSTLRVASGDERTPVDIPCQENAGQQRIALTDIQHDPVRAVADAVIRGSVGSLLLGRYLG